MNLTAIFIAALSLAQSQVQVNNLKPVPTCRSLSKEMDTILAKQDFGTLEMDRELSGPRLQYIKMNCKDGQSNKLADNILKMLLSTGVDAPQFDPEFGFGDGAAVAKTITIGSTVESGKDSVAADQYKRSGSDQDPSEKNYLGINERNYLL